MLRAACCVQLALIDASQTEPLEVERVEVASASGHQSRSRSKEPAPVDSIDWGFSFGNFCSASVSSGFVFDPFLAPDSVSAVSPAGLRVSRSETPRQSVQDIRQGGV